MDGIGIDLLEISRLERALDRWPNLAVRLFTDAEREYAQRRARPAQHLAARFCAKEAVAKALGLDRWRLRDVEVVGGGDSLRLVLHGAASRRADELGGEVAVSLTHSREMAGAVAVIR